MYLIFDTETTGLPHNYSAPVTDLDNWPRLVQIAWQLHGPDGKLLNHKNYIVRPDGFTIPFFSQKVHGISTKRATDEGHDLKEVLNTFLTDVDKTQLIVGHNISFDTRIIGAELVRTNIESKLLDIKTLDTSEVSVDFCQLVGGLGGKLKKPKLVELHEKLFGEPFEDAHDAAYDVEATSKCFFGLLKESVISPFDDTVIDEINYEAPQLEAANFVHKQRKSSGIPGRKVDVKDIQGPFCHLHLHSQFSILQATPNIKGIIEKTNAYGMPAVALTDLGNMFGAFQFVREALKNKIKPIVGCEFFISQERKKTRFTKDNPDKRYNQVLLAKNRAGYNNLARLSSLGYVEGLYGLFPRIDKDLIVQHKEGLIALSGNMSSEIPHLILNVGEHQAEEALQWWLEIFEDDFYIEVSRHHLEAENHLNEILLSFAEKYQVKVIAANDVYYLDEKDAEAHDVLLCIKENEKKSTEIGRGRGYRFGFPNHHYYFKSQDEMKALYPDIPEAIENIKEVVDKVELYELERPVLLPKYNIPQEFQDEKDLDDDGNRGENNYLRHLTYEGAKKRYGTITDEIRERLDFELATIENTGYPGYFLIVQDFTSKAREMNVAVGPGRGSAAGSAVAYCIGITNVDPIKYDLLFERFLNPDRISLPDIDIDFDDEGRDKVIDYVINKYGKNQVAQIITYGTMAAKSSIRDAGRVMELPLPETDAIAKLIPEKPGTSLSKAFEEVGELKQIKSSDNLPGKVLKQAEVLEGSLRNTGTHACGVIITPGDITEYIPVSTSKDSDMLITQFDNSVVEDAGMLKMDFLGLKTLSIIKTAIENIKASHGITIDPDKIPLDDPKTYELYQRGATNGTFQFESAGMQKHLRALKPDRFEDLIAMNALYRPGPMQYIPNFISRKHGNEKITYDLDEMEEFLAETYGITVYQEQVMLLSQKLAGFTKGQADALRKGMGKKKRAIIDELKPKFFDGCKKNGFDEKVVKKIWDDWEAFAEYAFNKSHSTCYSVVAFQTAYLKANYPAEYMAAVLTHNQSDISKVTFFMEECRNTGIKVLGPHLNESGIHFTVNKEGVIRFGLGAIKGTGEAAVQAIISEREEGGPFKDIFDFSKRVNLRAVNKKTFEALAKSGAFDCFEEYHRRQYLDAANSEGNLIEKSIKYANKMHQEVESAQVSLFGGTESQEIARPRIEPLEQYSEIEKLNIEKEVVGLYISGHPLEAYQFELDMFCNATLQDLNDPEKLRDVKNIKLGGIVTNIEHRTSKKGNPFGRLTLEDFSGNYTFTLFSKNYLKFKTYFEPNWFLYMQGHMQKSWRGDQLEFNITEINHLGEIRDQLTKSVKLNVRLEDINEQLVEQLSKLSSDNPGNCPLKLFINTRNDDEKLVLDMRSRKLKIQPNNDFIKSLEALPEITYTIEV